MNAKKVGKLADHPTTNGRQFHLQTVAGDLAPNCIIVGSPARADHIAEHHLVEARPFGNPREIRAYTGLYMGIRVSVVTHGMGGPYAGIVLTEACNSGGRRFIRVGSCGAIQRHAKVGELVISSGAVRYDGSSDNWAMPQFPAIASHYATAALEEAAKSCVAKAHIGVTATTSDFREGQARPGYRRFVPPHIRERHTWLKQLGVLAYDMETASVFTWCLANGGLMAGSIMAVFANRVTGKLEEGAGETMAVEVGLEALRSLAIKYPL